MNQDDQTSLIAEIKKHWKGKFSDSDLSDWCKEFSQYELVHVLTALTEFRRESSFRPKQGEIHKLIKSRHPELRSATPVNVTLPKTFAQIIRNGNPHLSHRSDAELVMLYHRHWWKRCRQSDDDRETKCRQCALDLAELGIELEMAMKMAQFIVDDQKFFCEALDDVKMLAAPQTSDIVECAFLPEASK